jgi:hypothetical protein
MNIINEDFDNESPYNNVNELLNDKEIYFKYNGYNKSNIIFLNNFNPLFAFKGRSLCLDIALTQTLKYPLSFFLFFILKETKALKNLLLFLFYINYDNKIFLIYFYQCILFYILYF